MKNSKLLVIQACLPSYRVGLFKVIAKQMTFKLVVGDEYFQKSVKSGNLADTGLEYFKSRNLYFLSRRGLLQTWDGWLAGIFSDTIKVVELNPRCVTSWLCLCASFLGFGKSILWGHLHDRKGQIRSFSLRAMMLKISNGALFYTKSQMEQFLDIPFGKNKVCGYAPNSVVYHEQICAFEQPGTDFLYVGRLVTNKKPQFLLEAFLLACKKGLQTAQLHIVGSGEEKLMLESIAKKSKYSERVHFYGHISDYETLKRLYRRSVCSISPGYVGLSITQSFSFGRPMLISETEPHSPEIDSFQPTINGRFFVTDNVKSLACELTSFYNQRDYWARQSESINSIVEREYTYESMSRGFLDMLERIREDNA